MTVGNAMDFIKRGVNDGELRERLNATQSMSGCEKILSDEGLQFSHKEFEQAYHNLLTLCQEVEAADQLKEFKCWWELLSHILEPSACSNACRGCCG